LFTVERVGRVATLALAATVVFTGCTEPTPPAETPAVSASPAPERGPITFAAPGDPTGTLAAEIQDWNAAHPREPVTLRELPMSADARRADFLERAQSGNGEYTVMAVDLAFVPELAKAGAFAPLAPTDFPTTGLLNASVESGTVDGTLYAYPYTADAGLLYYRKDVLASLQLSPPTTWAELAQICAVVTRSRAEGCYASPYHEGEPLTVSVLEAIQGAGGQGFDPDGNPLFSHYAASAGVSWMVDGLRSGRASTASASLDDDTIRRSFERGGLVFMRDWATAWPLIGKAPDSSVNASQVGVVELPGANGPASAVFGGLDLAVSANGGNLATARDFVSFLTGESQQRERFQATGAGPTIEALYSDQTLMGTDELGSVLSTAISRATPRPAVADYAQLSAAVSDGVAPVLAGTASASQALAALQGELSGIVAKR